MSNWNPLFRLRLVSTNFGEMKRDVSIPQIDLQSRSNGHSSPYRALDTGPVCSGFLGRCCIRKAQGACTLRAARDSTAGRISIRSVAVVLSATQARAGSGSQDPLRVLACSESPGAGNRFGIPLRELHANAAQSANDRRGYHHTRGHSHSPESICDSRADAMSQHDNPQPRGQMSYDEKYSERVVR